jgi:hypothetical protein
MGHTYYLAPVRLRVLGALLLVLVAGAPSTVAAGPYATNGITRVSKGAPFASCTADDVAAQPGQNYAATEVEPWIDVNPLNRANMVGLWQQDRWSNGGARGLVAGVTTDGGATWTSVVIPKGSRCSGGTYDRTTDPWLSFASNGDLHAISLALSSDSAVSAILVNKSVDGGFTWSDPKTLIHDTNAATFNDKQSVTADPTDPSYVYAVWDRSRLASDRKGARRTHEAAEEAARSDIMFARSTNGGTTWEAVRAIYAPTGADWSVGNQIVVSPNGTLVDITEFFRGSRIYVAVLRSTDKGVTWSAPAMIARQYPVAVRDPDTGEPVRAGEGLPDIGVNPVTGRLYAVWSDSRFSGGRHNDVAVSTSGDDGLTWTKPRKVNKTPTTIRAVNRQAFTPSVEMTAGGTVGVTYYDFRKNTAGGGTRTDYWFGHCHADCTSGANWSETHVSGSFNIRRAPVARGYFLGDYQGLVTAGRAFRALFARTTTADRANVYFTKLVP